MDTNVSEVVRDSATQGLYDRLEDRCLMRDQKGASDVLYDLIRAGRPLNEIVSEGVRIHAPYTHVPYHERIDDGYPNFVNNDHCLLSARATINLTHMVPSHLSMLPMAQTIWYIPTGLDIWNQKINKAPGHYTRHRGNMTLDEKPPAPVVYWPDQEPAQLTGSLKERLNEWMTLVHRGEVLPAYRHFLGLMQNPAERNDVLAEMCFAGLMDVQDRLLHNRSYTTGHKAYRARSTVELGNALGWDKAHNVIYAGALDIAVGPRWYSTYEVACNYIKMMIEGEALHAVPYGGVSEAELAVLRNREPVNQEEAAELITAILRQGEIETLEVLTRLLKAGKDPRRLIDVTQLAVAQLVLETQDPTAFNMPHHCYEYQNTLAWFYDTFDHPRRLRLLYVAAMFANRVAYHQQGLHEVHPVSVQVPSGANALSAQQLLQRVDQSICALNGAECIGWVQAYCDNVTDKTPLVQTIALAATKLGNDPHNQEIAQCMLMDFGTNRQPDRDKLLLAAAYHTAMHRKYGDPLEPARRFGQALGFAELH
ncbi:hypothetical protein [Rhodopila sp.]|uniref:hypothetical protein n=1 Tax=Rhodopila sp. TaxID=2480087 RepID=UPI002C37E637|nr:hypothetical protein [Rhodopila sp.]HVZ10683.1 hypothetical protein [Rhodopila sp.]